MPEMHAPDERKVVAIDPPDPSWIAIRFAPFHYQAGFGSRRRVSGIFGAPRRLSEESIDAIVVNDVKDPCITACRVDRSSHQFMLESSRYERSDGSPEHRHVDPFDVRRQLASNDGTIDPETAHLVAQIEAVWRKMETGFRHAHRDGHCRLLARAGSPHTPEFAEIPWDVFEHYQITDWRRGGAQSEAGDRLYALHVAAPSQKPNVPALDTLQGATKLEPETELALVAATLPDENLQHTLHEPVPNRQSAAREKRKIKRVLNDVSGRVQLIARHFFNNPGDEPVDEKISQPIIKKLSETLGAGVDPRTVRKAVVVARKIRRMNPSTETLQSVGFHKIQ